MTLMESEAAETPAIVSSLLANNRDILVALRDRLNIFEPSFALTIGRGSSDHACTFAKYLLETRFGLVTASAAPSVVTIYHAKLHLKKALIIAISQSGESPDVCEMMAHAKNNGSITLAIVNNINSPLAKEAEFVLPMLAHEEKAIAATKTFIASIASLVQLTAFWANDNNLLRALAELPNRLEEALLMDWSHAIPAFKEVIETLVIARGYTFPMALEAALKFKETSAIQAEAFSAAEVLHGPFALIRKQHPYLIFLQDDATAPSIIQLCDKIKNLGGTPYLAAPKKMANQHAVALPLPKSLHPLCDPIVLIQVFYLFIAKLACARGYNPDSPTNLQKITKTR